MKPKERRDRLFKTSRPNIREMKLLDENGYTKDMSILWGAFKKGSPESAVTQEEFAKSTMEKVDSFDRKWIVEDTNKIWGGEGAIGVILASYNGWELKPEFEPFTWSTPRNTLRAIVSFLQMMRYDKAVGIVNVHSLKSSANFFNHVSKYGVLKYAAKIPQGDKDGDRYIYYIRGRKDGVINTIHR